MDKTNKILGYLPQHWKKDVNSNNYNFILSIASESVDVDNNLQLLEDSVEINNASGENLDDLALLFAIYRNDDESDDSFRSRIKAFFQANLGGGSELPMRTAIANSLGLDLADVTINTLSENIFDVNIAIDSNTDLSILNNVEGVVNTSKAAGMFFDTRKGDSGIIVTSKDNIFLTNISKYNGEDTLL